MQKTDSKRPYPSKEFDLWDELIQNNEIDEVGLLDLVFLEEIINQKKADRAVR